MSVRLGVNIDHVATVRNARGGAHPDPVRAAQAAAEAGADGITFHLREDRRHIRDEDLPAIAAASGLPLNLEMAAVDEMLAIAVDFRPHAACLVPERREERTTEGGLDVAGGHNRLAPVVRALGDVKVRVSLFIEPRPAQIDAAADIGAEVVEFHTGRYCHLHAVGDEEAAAAELDALARAAARAHARGLEVHMGHGLSYETVRPVAAIPEVRELNIGHFLIGEALFVGLGPAIGRMRALIAAARGEVAA
ncbi:MAG: pyridoxine 5'-phosphate synthase [Caulobacterales bacterium]|nr:pyridoxine 5'-phosphate synthase [Caulobacterales bacterium]